MKALVVIICGMLTQSAIAQGTPSETSYEKFLTIRAGIDYKPTVNIKYENDNEGSNLYDFTGYRIGCDYQINRLVTLGPSFEYLDKNIEAFGYYQNSGITRYEFSLAGRINHQLTDIGNNLMVFGIEGGYGILSEDDGDDGNGYLFGSLVGLDIALGDSFGAEILYKYQFSVYRVDDVNYRFNGSVIQTGLNYRIGL